MTQIVGEGSGEKFGRSIISSPPFHEQFIPPILVASTPLLHA